MCGWFTVFFLFGEGDGSFLSSHLLSLCPIFVKILFKILKACWTTAALYVQLLWATDGCKWTGNVWVEKTDAEVNCCQMIDELDRFDIAFCQSLLCCLHRLIKTCLQCASTWLVSSVHTRTTNSRVDLGQNAHSYLWKMNNHQLTHNIVLVLTAKLFATPAPECPPLTYCASIIHNVGQLLSPFTYITLDCIL